MEIKVKIATKEHIQYAVPRNENGVRACRLVNREYLTTDELKTLELMGFTIVIEEAKRNS